jgi:hypothetical protein
VFNDEQNRFLAADRARQEAERGRLQAEKEKKDLMKFHYTQTVKSQMENENQNRQCQMLQMTVERQALEMRDLRERSSQECVL